MEKETVIQLFTPGLDSYLGYHYLSKKYNVKRIYFKLKSRYTDNEIKILNNFYNDIYIYENLNLSDIEHDDAYIPNRNLLMATLASSLYPNISKIFINGMKDDRVNDNREDVFNRLSIVVSMSMDKPIMITSEFWNKEKSEMVSTFVIKNEPIIEHLATRTYSCFSKFFIYNKTRIYNGNPIDGKFNKNGRLKIYGCCSCPACFRRFAALSNANIFIPFRNDNIVDGYRGDAINKNIHPFRYFSTLEYIRFLDFMKGVR